MLVGIFPGIIICLGMAHSYEGKMIERKISQVKNQCMILANHLYVYGYLDDPSLETQNFELQQTSNLYDGRIMIIDDAYKIIKDTYSISEGKYIISEEVVKCFAGETTHVYDNDNHYLELTTPIIGRDNVIYGVMLTSVSTEDIAVLQGIFERRMTMMMVCASFTVLFFAIFLSSRMVRPLNEVRSAIKAYDDGFRIDEISVRGYNETVEVTDAFNLMLAHMRVQDEQRQDFVANVSHELKTPITSVKILAESLMSGEDTPIEMYKEFMNDIIHEVDREDRIINDLLSLVKTGEGADTLNIESVDIEKLIIDILRTLKPLADKANVDLGMEIIRPVIAEVDEIKLSLALMNLMENAIKYNKSGGYVRVTLDAEPLFFIISIKDNGIGIPEDAINSIFERFYRVDKSHSREIGGTGLGLSIARSIIVMHEGAIKVESKPDEGSIFTVRIPISYIKKGGEA